MKKLIIALCLLPAFAVAQGQNYGGVQYAMANYSEDVAGFTVPDFDLSALVFRGGHKFTENFAVEGRFGFGIGDDTNTISDGTVSADATVELDRMYGVYAVGILPLNDHSSLYGILGYTDAEVTAEVEGFSVSESDSDISFGVGADFSVGKNVAVNLEYMNYYDDDNVTIDALSIGATFTF